jgi:gluconate 5-dehydrogenase
MEHPKHTQRFSLSGKTALITGSSRGLGWEIAKSMAEAGAHVILNGRDREALENNVRMLSEVYLQAEAIVLDASDTTAVTQWVADQVPEVDILVNNTGPRARRPIAELMPQDFRNILDGGLVRAHNLARLCTPGMIGRGGG